MIEFPEELRIDEYAFPDDYDYFYEDLREDVKALNLSLIKDVTFDQPCSKSGVIVSVKHTVCDEDYDYTLEDYYNDAEPEKTVKELREVRKGIKFTVKDYSNTVKALKEQIEQVKKVVEAVAIGKRYACFSNGEVCFMPINKEITGYNQSFTPYYNPNED